MICFVLFFIFTDKKKMEFVEGTPFFLGDYLNASLYEWSMGAGQLRHGYLIEFIQKDACRESSILLLFHRNTLSNETDKKKKKNLTRLEVHKSNQ